MQAGEDGKGTQAEEGLRMLRQQARVLLTTREVAAIFKVTGWTIRDWRATGRGPRYIKIAPRRGNGIVRYRLRDVEAFIEKSLMSPSGK